MSEKSNYRQTLGKFATGVTIITTCADDNYFGFTANSFTSVSLDPPLVLFCIKTDANFMNALLKSNVFGVNILSRQQEHLSNKFANPNLASDERFADVTIATSPSMCPRLKESLAFLECEVVKISEEGDHNIIIGRVVSFDQYDNKEPLLYYSGAYRNLQP